MLAPSSTIQRIGCAVCVAVALAACGGERKAQAPQAIAGLSAVPASATVVVSVDVPRVAGSPLVMRAIDQLLLRDADLAGRWQRLEEECKLDFVGSVKHMLVALGPKGEGGAPVLLVASGKISEPELATCVRALVGKGGGTLTSKTTDGRTLYLAKEGDRSAWFAFGAPSTVVLGSQEALVIEALGPGKKIESSEALRELLQAVDRKAPVWAVGQVDPAIAEPLLQAAGGALRAGPRGYLFAADPTSGLRASLTALMASEQDAKSLESLMGRQLGLLAVAAQMKGLGRLVGKVRASAKGQQMQLSVSLDPTEINQLLKAVDSAGSTPQDAPPAAPSQPSP